jgi:Spy/CpxP family protein refolding chaperone
MQHPGVSLTTIAASTLIATASLLGAAPALAQAESFLVGPGSSVGPSTKVKPKNCVTGADGSITCDTQLENSPSDTQARPIYEQFKN